MVIKLQAGRGGGGGGGPAGRVGIAVAWGQSSVLCE